DLGAASIFATASLDGGVNLPAAHGPHGWPPHGCPLHGGAQHGWQSHDAFGGRGSAPAAGATKTIGSPHSRGGLAISRRNTSTKVLLSRTIWYGSLCFGQASAPFVPFDWA